MQPNYTHRQILSNEEEQDVAEYLQICSRTACGLTTDDTRRLAYEVGVQNNHTIPGSCRASKMAREDCECIAQAFEKAFTLTNVLSGFKETGIHPFNPDAFTYADFMFFAVTDIPEDMASNSPSKEPVVNSKNTAESPGLPKAQPQKTNRNNNRKRGRSTIITHIPEKNILIEREAQKNNAIITRQKKKLDIEILILLDNAPVHKSRVMRDVLSKLDLKELNHTAYSPDIAPCNYFLVRKLKQNLRGRRFVNDDELKWEVESSFEEQKENFYFDGLSLLISKYKKYIELLRGLY
ncbi:hypothetical protein ILUMI_22885 [Ignelater luminosus]|uniref:Tc1-like transposase DDE domain-containing protein n=1 Tax=Ignelater luminosus TaxID=2038154 RepID=A0A8K0CD13_IGNLU|nr:hypothetical protein ILUMI_22885 [Ignelater luminosus]